ncbi:MAG: cytochrome c biogenesis protein CcsA [Thermoplasmata archaeon]
MEIGSILIYTALFAAILSIIFTVKNQFLKDDKNEKNKKCKDTMKKKEEDTFDYILFLSLSFALFLIAYYFAVSDFSIHYVWENSAKDLDLYLKLAGIYAGQAGSLFLWTFLMALSLVLENIHRKYRISKQKVVSDEKLHALSRIIALSVISVFLTILILDDPFTPAHTFTIETLGPHGLENIEINPSDYPDGNGMNPMLQNFWMVIHPPILFLGYAFSLLPFSSLLAKLFTKKEEFSALFWARLAWFFLTLGIGIGAIWAYVTLGWGGYWAWDPVETSSLIPWFTLTALLHSLLLLRRNMGNYLFPALYASSSFILVLFATYVTRSGAWAQGSVHAWSESTTSNIILLLIIAVAFISYGTIAYRYINEKHDKKNEADDKSGLRKRTKKEYLSFVYQACDACFAFIPLLLFVGLLVSRGSASAPSFYETRLYPILAIMFAIIPFCATKFNRKKLIPLFIISILSSLFIAIFLSTNSKPNSVPFYSFGTFSITRDLAASILVAPSVFLLASSLISLVELQTDKRKHAKFSAKIKFYKAGSHIAHIGLALILLGYVSSSTWSYMGTIELEHEKGFVGEYEFEKGKIDIEELPKKTIYTVELAIYKDGSFVAKAYPKFVYYKELGRSVAEVEIVNQITEDIYITINSLDPDRNGNIDRISFEIHINPGINLLWSGLVALSVAILIRLFDPAENASIKEENMVKKKKTKDDKKEIKMNKKEALDKEAWEVELDRELERELEQRGK